MDLIKGFVYNRGQVEIDGKNKHSYLIGLVIICDKPLKNLSNDEYREKNNLGGRGETLIAAHIPFSDFSDIINSFQKYEPPYALGTADAAFCELKYLNLESLEKINEN